MEKNQKSGNDTKYERIPKVSKSVETSIQPKKSTSFHSAESILPRPNEDFTEWNQRFEKLFDEWKIKRANTTLSDSQNEGHKNNLNYRQQQSEGGI